MSRIHDALKKAEEQRLANLSEAQGAVSETIGTGKFSAGMHELSFANEEVPASKPPEAIDDTPAAPVIEQPTADRLHGCTRTVWSPSKDALFLTAQDNNSPGMEEFRTLRAKLFQIRAKRPLKTILISSALPSEGKSFVSANLAQAFARQRGSRTLLIDADLRKPHMHELIGAPSSPGLCDYLSGQADEFKVIQRSAANEDLFFIPGGKVNSTASELIGNGRMRQLLDSLSPLFSWVVIDSSPVIPVSDPTRLAEICDGVLLVVQAGSTSHVIAERAKREFHDAPLLGVVFNQVRTTEDRYHYKYSYSNYGR